MRPAVVIATTATLVALALPVTLLASAPSASGPDSPSISAAVQSAAQQPEAEQPSTLADAPGATASATTSNAVSILDGQSTSFYRFAPARLTVPTGTEVIWTNKGNQIHNVRGGSLHSQNLQTGEQYSFTFSQAGTFNYICSIHPFMKASVTVSADASTGGTTDTNNSGGTSADGTTTGTTTTPSTTGSSFSTGTTSSGSLPSTGLDLFLLGEIGLALLLGGLVLRARRGVTE